MVRDSVSFISAFGAGFLSFISPCVLPLVPVYLTTMTGLTMEELGARENRQRSRIIRTCMAFCLGLSAVFIALGLSATTIGTFLTEHLRVFELIAGICIVLFGLHMTGALKIAFLYRTFQMGKKAQTSQTAAGVSFFLKPFSMGAAFAFGWTPCVGPILAAVLALAATRETVAQGGLLLAVYSLGLSLPFLLAGLAFSSFTSKYQKFRKHLHTVEIVSGLFLIAFGVLIATHNFSALVGWFSRFIPEPKF